VKLSDKVRNARAAYRSMNESQRAYVVSEMGLIILGAAAVLYGCVGGARLVVLQMTGQVVLGHAGAYRMTESIGYGGIRLRSYYQVVEYAGASQEFHTYDLKPPGATVRVICHPRDPTFAELVYGRTPVFLAATDWIYQFGLGVLLVAVFGWELRRRLARRGRKSG
jgi:hypothetical protein